MAKQPLFKILGAAEAVVGHEQAADFKHQGFPTAASIAILRRRHRRGAGSVLSQRIVGIVGRYIHALRASAWHAAHRVLPASTDLARIVSVQESRVVAKDWTVRWRNQVLQLPREAAALVQSGRRITVCEPLAGALRMFVGEQEISWSPILSAPLPKPPAAGPIASWRGPFFSGHRNRHNDGTFLMARFRGHF